MVKRTTREKWRTEIRLRIKIWWIKRRVWEEIGRFWENTQRKRKHQKKRIWTWNIIKGFREKKTKSSKGIKFWAIVHCKIITGRRRIYSKVKTTWSLISWTSRILLKFGKELDECFVTASTKDGRANQRSSIRIFEEIIRIIKRIKYKIRKKWWKIENGAIKQ